MLNRRTLLAAAFIAPLAAGSAFAADGFVDYQDGLIDRELAAGKTVFVDYSATWCGTCRTQERVISQLLQENPAYASKMVFVRVDWDQWSEKPVTTDRNIPRRSTLLVLRGDKELGRVVAGTGKAEIKALLDEGV